MGVMRDIRVRDERTQAMFQPLKETVLLLKQYNVPVKDTTVSQLEDGPVKWKAVDKKKKQRTEALNAKVISEQMEVRRRSDAFQKNVDAFTEHFQAVAPFHVKVRLLLPFLRYLSIPHARFARHAPMFSSSSLDVLLNQQVDPASLLAYRRPSKASVPHHRRLPPQGGPRLQHAQLRQPHGHRPQREAAPESEGPLCDGYPDVSC
jgi:hypothetical protein